MMNGTRTAHPQVVVSGYNIHHIDVGSGYRNQFQRVSDDSGNMSESMTFAKSIIFGENLFLHKVHDFEIYLLLHRYSSTLFI